MQTVVNFPNGTHFDFFPVILIALVVFFILYVITGRKSVKAARKDFISRKDTYDFMYGQLLEKETNAVK